MHWDCSCSFSAPRAAITPPDTQPNFPEDVKTIAVPAFKNETLTYRIEQMLTASVVREFTTRTRYRIINDAGGDADATLHGTVLSTAASPLTYDTATGRAASVMVVVSMKVTLTDRNGKVLYQNPAYLFREQYEVSQDLASFFEEDSPGVPPPVARLRPHSGVQHPGGLLGVKRLLLLLTLTVSLIAVALYIADRGRPALATPPKNSACKTPTAQFSLSQFRGQVVVLNFWATWCPPCVEELPSLMSMQERTARTRCSRARREHRCRWRCLPPLSQERNVNFLTVRDPEQKVAALYGTSGWPETYIIDRQGVMRRKFVGASTGIRPRYCSSLSKL